MPLFSKRNCLERMCVYIFFFALSCQNLFYFTLTNFQRFSVDSDITKKSFSNHFFRYFCRVSHSVSEGTTETCQNRFRSTSNNKPSLAYSLTWTLLTLAQGKKPISPPPTVEEEEAEEENNLLYKWQRQLGQDSQWPTVSSVLSYPYTHTLSFFISLSLSFFISLSVFLSLSLSLFSLSKATKKTIGKRTPEIPSLSGQGEFQFIGGGFPLFPQRTEESELYRECGCMVVGISCA